MNRSNWLFLLRRFSLLGLLGISLIFPLFMKETYYLSIIIFCGINAIAAVGVDLLVSYAGQISLGQAAFMGIGAYASSILSLKLGINPWLSMIICIPITLLFAYILAIPTLKLEGYFLAIATLGFGIIMRVLFVYFHNITGGVSGLSNIPGLSIFGFGLDTEQRYYYLVWVAVFLSLLMTKNLISSKFGRALMAIHNDNVRAGVRGIDVTRYKRLAFLYSAALAAISGALYAHYLHFITPFNFDLTKSIMLIVMVILGGMGTLTGAILGAGIITALPEALRVIEVGETIVYGMIIVLVMIFLPLGIIGEAKNAFNKIPNKT